MNDPASHDRVPRRLVWVMAVACGVAVANVYYAQPLLAQMQRTFHVGAAAIGIIPTATQLGFALGLVLLVPLGDRHERRRLLWVLAMLSAVTCVGVGLAPSLGALAVASFAMGVVSVIPPTMTPYAATLAPEKDRGAVVGLVMTGLLVGVVAARALGGLLGARWGWRAVFLGAAGLMAVMAGVMRWLLPSQRVAAANAPSGLLRSLFALVRSEPGLRRSALRGATAFGAYSAFWAPLALYLQRAPFHAGAAVAGAYGLVGFAGATVAPVAGRLADRGRGDAAQRVAFAMGLAGFAVCMVARHALLGLAVGALLLDLGVQASHITNLGRIYSLRADARSRLNTVYMFSYFVGGAAGSWSGVAAFARWGFVGVCGVGAAFLAVGLAAQLGRASTDMARRATPSVGQSFIDSSTSSANGTDT